MELSLLCDCDVTLIIFPKNGRLYQYSSSNVDAVFRRVTEAVDIAEAKSNEDYVPLCKKLGGDSGDEHHDGSSQSPGREDKPPKIMRVNPQSESASYKPQIETHTTPAPPSQPRNPVDRIPHPDFLSSDSHIVSSFGLRNDPLVYNLTPRTEKRYEEINKTFEVALKSTNAQYEPNQMHPFPQAQQLVGAVNVIPPIASVPIISPITSMPAGNMGSYSYPSLQDNYTTALAERNRIPDINRYPFTYAQNPGNYTVLPEPRGHYPPPQPNDMNMTLPNLALEPQVEPQEPKRQNTTESVATNATTTQNAAPTGRTSLKARRSFGRGDLSLPTQPQSLSGGGNNSANSADYHHPFQGDQPLPTPEGSRPPEAEDRFILPVPISSILKPPENMNKEHIVLFSPTSMHPIWPGMKPERVDPLPQVSHPPGSGFNQGVSLQGWNASEERNSGTQQPIPTTSEQSAKTNERDM